MSKREKLSAKAFETASGGYDEMISERIARKTGLGYEEMIELLIKLSGPIGGSNILDLATGTGNVALAAARSVDGDCQVVAVDLAEGMVKLAKEKVGEEGFDHQGDRGVCLARASGESLPFAEGSFDLVTCSLALHHMPVSPVLQEIKRVLKPSGRLVMADAAASPAWRTPWGRIIVSIYNVYERLKERRPLRTGSKMYTAEEWMEILAGSHFTLIEEKSFFKKSWGSRIIVFSAMVDSGESDK